LESLEISDLTNPGRNTLDIFELCNIESQQRAHLEFISIERALTEENAVFALGFSTVQ